MTLGRDSPLWPVLTGDKSKIAEYENNVNLQAEWFKKSKKLDDRLRAIQKKYKKLMDQADLKYSECMDKKD